ncbi:fungal-specific transcription factor domain-containing protein [Xylariaceae sp. FL0255]|nr:fungal-specific transcription factor domain-containing protein [Xylariaceae sp. FL0255]
MSGHDDMIQHHPRRNTARRTCDWCKLMRIKCQCDTRPCSSCVQSRRADGLAAERPLRSIADAVHEIDSLRVQVNEFEHRKTQIGSRSGTSSPGTPSSRRNSLFDSHGSRLSPSRNGVRIDSVLYGVASLPFFLTQMRQFLEATRPQSQVTLDISAHAGDPRNMTDASNFYLQMNFLPAAQEVHFLDLFWQTHFLSYPVIKESDFRKEFKALVNESDPRAPRKASPLIDIVLALCIQLASLRLRQRHRSHNGYQMSFDIIAMLLGLHNELSATDSELNREVNRRTWWSIHALDAKLSMDIGQTPMIDRTLHSCRLPSDLRETATWLAPSYPWHDSLPTWLGFQTQRLRLLETVKNAWHIFYARYDTLVGENGHIDFLGHTRIREECASLLPDITRSLDVWAEQVPAGYYVRRKSGGRPFQAMGNRPPDLVLEHNIPVHGLRQQLLLELQYHYYSMNLFRPFICFAYKCESLTGLSDERATICIEHAIALTSIIYFTMTSAPEALFGEYDIYRWQKDSLFTLLGFAYSFPESSSTEETRKVIETAIANVNLFSEALPEARSVVTLARALADDVNDFLSSMYNTNSWLSPPTPMNTRVFVEAPSVLAPAAIMGPPPYDQYVDMPTTTEMEHLEDNEPSVNLMQQLDCTDIEFDLPNDALASISYLNDHCPSQWQENQFQNRSS